MKNQFDNLISDIQECTAKLNKLAEVMKTSAEQMEDVVKTLKRVDEKLKAANDNLTKAQLVLSQRHRNLDASLN